MAIKNSAIQWTGASYNPWQGCVKKTVEIDGQTVLREECRNCYMYREKKRYGQQPQIVVRSKPPTFNKPLKLQREVEQGKRTGIDRLVFTCSWSDWFNPEADDWRPEAWEIARQCPDLIFQILTKLPERIGDHLPPFWDEIKDRIWLGYSCGMPGAEKGIEHLIQHDSAIRFLSCEPLLGQIDIEKYLYCYITKGPEMQRPDPIFGSKCPICPARYSNRVDWVIVGGESGGKEARFMDPEWALRLLKQCREADAPFFVKQMGSVWARNNGAKHPHGGDMDEWDERLRVREFPIEIE